MATTSAKPTGTQIREWRARGHAYLLIAAEIAEWAADRERFTVLPDDDFFSIEASPSTYKRARNSLVTRGVLEINDGPHFVAWQPAVHVIRTNERNMR